MKKKITYGDNTNDNWNGIIGLEDPLFVKWSKEIEKVLQGYSLWIYGGVLEEWLAMDIDGSLIGPYNPNKINQVLEDIVRISFEYGVFPDIKYAFDGKLFNWSDWKSTEIKQTIKYAYYRPNMFVNGKKIEWGTMENGLWVAERTWPMIGTLNKNHDYKDPIQIA